MAHIGGYIKGATVATKHNMIETVTKHCRVHTVHSTRLGSRQYSMERLVMEAKQISQEVH